MDMGFVPSISPSIHLGSAPKSTNSALNSSRSAFLASRTSRSHVSFSPAAAIPRSSSKVTMSTSSSYKIIPGGGIVSAKGFAATGHCAGLKASKKDDMALVICTEPNGAAAAGVFTQSVVRAAPVDICREQLKASGNTAKAIVINSGQANAATGQAGYDDAQLCIKTLAELLKVEKTKILVSSTGVIGKRIKMPEYLEGLKALVQEVEATEVAGQRAAKAIMTTDLVSKSIAFECEIQGKRVVVGGMGKGSGMIHPNMATMLSYITCDVGVEGKAWQGMVARAADKSFNQITVDGDTSTNDTLIGLASGASGVLVKEGTKEFQMIEDMVTSCCQYIAKSIARDGEGSTVLIEVKVEGAASDADARCIAKTVCGSNLFKAAVFGRDPNWGRIAAAAGRAPGVMFDQQKLDISIGKWMLLKQGQLVEYNPAEVSKYMADAAKGAYMSGEDTVAIRVKVGDGPGSGLAWGCDLSYDYVKINAEYTT